MAGVVEETSGGYSPKGRGGGSPERASLWWDLEGWEWMEGG